MASRKREKEEEEEEDFWVLSYGSSRIYRRLSFNYMVFMGVFRLFYVFNISNNFPVFDFWFSGSICISAQIYRATSTWVAGDNRK